MREGGVSREVAATGKDDVEEQRRGAGVGDRADEQSEVTAVAYIQRELVDDLVRQIDMDDVRQSPLGTPHGVPDAEADVP
jgi:hypothetical protein